MSIQPEDFARQAIEIAVENVRNGGGPFGAVIVRNGQVVSHGANRVTASNDPTAHAEVQAIRDACRKLNTFELADCELYTSCEPCPMCLGAIYWARLKAVYYCSVREDAAAAGFDDSFIYDEVPLNPGARKITFKNLLRKEGAASFAAWNQKSDKIRY